MTRLARRSHVDIHDRIAAARADRDRLASQDLELESRAASDGVRERRENIARGIARLDLELDALGAEWQAEFRRAYEAGEIPESAMEHGDVDMRTGRAPEEPAAQPASRDQQRGLRTIDQHHRAGLLTDAAAGRLDAVIRRHDPAGMEARYLAAVGEPAYATAFAKMLADPATGHLRFTPQEVAAVQAASAVESERALSIGTPSAGGYALPITLDPSILLTSSGALNPIRALARVITITGNTWKGVSSAGVTASYDPEASEVSDDTPTLAQPSIAAARGTAYVPFSIELEQDWAGLADELVRLISDSRDVLDAQKFWDGSGTDEPAGIITGLSTAQRVQTAGAATLAVGDVYALKQAVPARFMPDATWALHPSRVDAFYRLTPSGSTSEPQIMPDRDGPILGRPAAEWTSVPATALTTGTKIALYGDFKAAFTIADRIGMTAEIVRHVIGANRRPTGERGLYVYWRTGSKVTVPNALRYLEAS